MAFIDELQELVEKVPLQSHYVKEWGKDVYFKPATPHETALIKAKLNEDDPAIYYVVQTVILKALNENGKRLFCDADAKKLRKMPYQQAMNELTAAMNERISVEDAEGNSETNQA